MIGKVYSTNKQSGLLSVETAGGKLTVVEPLDPVSVAIDDVIRGDLESLGRETLRIARGEEFEASIHAVRCSRREAARLLRG